METSLFDLQLEPYLAVLSRARSLKELERMALYQRLKPRFERILDHVIQHQSPPPASPRLPHVRTTAWNIERGIEFDRIVEVLREHPLVRESDLLLLTELDYGMARSGNRKVPTDLAASLDLNLAFATSYINLEKGSGLEIGISGHNEHGLHGNAILSRFPILDAHSVALPNGRDKVRGKEKRIGCQRAVVGLIDHPYGRFRAVSTHLDAHSTQKHRMLQMRMILDDLDVFYPEHPALIGGDWNTSTYNSRHAAFSIAGYCRRVLMGVRHVIRNHYPYPDRYFERRLFQELEKRGYHYQDLNEPGGCTLHYHVEDLAANHRMADWIPNWCFWFINWALERNEGRCSFKLDWFAGKGIEPEEGFPPRVIKDVNPSPEPISDHDPILLDFRLSPKPSRSRSSVS